MPAPRIAMRRIREVLRLKDECGLTYSQIARSLQISKGSVANYLRGAEAAGLTHHEAALLDDAALSARLAPRPPATTKFAAPDFALVHRELKRKVSGWQSHIASPSRLRYPLVAENCFHARSQSRSTGERSGNSRESIVTRALRLPCWQMATTS